MEARYLKKLKDIWARSGHGHRGVVIAFTKDGVIRSDVIRGLLWAGYLQYSWYSGQSVFLSKQGMEFLNGKPTPPEKPKEPSFSSCSYEENELPLEAQPTLEGIGASLRWLSSLP